MATTNDENKVSTPRVPTATYQGARTMLAPCISPRKYPSRGQMDGVNDGTEAPRRVLTLAVIRGRPRLISRRRVRRTSEGTEDDASVSLLMAEIERLQRRRDELMSLHASSLLCSRRRDACIAVTREYQDIFRVGYVAPRERDILAYTSTRFDQELFTFGGCGIEMLLEQWRRYTRTFPSIHIETHATEVTPLVDNEDIHLCDAATAVGIVAVKGVVAGRIMRSTVATICPDIWRDPVLMHKLLEQEIVCPTIWSFYFNPQGRVIRLDLNVDVFEGFRTVDDITLNDLVQVTQNLSIDDNSFLPPVLDNL